MGSPQAERAVVAGVGGAAHAGLCCACDIGKGWRSRYPVSPAFLHAALWALQLWEVCEPARFWES